MTQGPINPTDWSTTTTPHPLHPAEHQLLRGLPQCCVPRRHAPLGQIVGELVERAGRTARRWHILRRGGRTTSPTSVGSSSRSGCATGWPRAAGAGCRSRRGWASSPALVADRRPQNFLHHLLLSCDGAGNGWRLELLGQGG
jgi:hypothetical protein